MHIKHNSKFNDQYPTHDIKYYKIVEKIIKDIYNDGPAGLLHLRILSQVIKCRICVWFNDHIAYTIGRATNANAKIDVEYHSLKNRAIGHWSLRGNRHPSTGSFGKNNCLYEVVAAQTGFNVVELRYRTANAIRRDQYAIGRHSFAVGDKNKMVGGARYIGIHPVDAGIILDASQYGYCHPDARHGHPRGHASFPGLVGTSDSIENYSINSRKKEPKTGFMSRRDQDFVAHYALLTNKAQDIMDNLNRGLINSSVYIGRHELDCTTLPKMMKWVLGRPQGLPMDFKSNDYMIYTFNRSSKKKIHIQYNHRKNCPIGHWTLRGGKNPTSACLGKNNCLYEVVASQTGWDPEELRFRTANVVRRDWYAIGNYILANGGLNTMIGGARYTGRSARDAGDILDRSQNGQCHPEGRSGHPRGHASSSGGGTTDSVEAYSHGRWRSGFLSRSDQDFVAHHSLITDQALRLMDNLNRGQFKADAHIDRYQLDSDSLPLAQIWSGGERMNSASEFRHVVLVGKHFLNQQNNISADIFVLTFYPVI